MKWILSFFVAFVAFGSTLAYAQTESGIKVIPASFEERVDSGSVLVREIKVTNISGEDREFFIYKRDITGVEEGGVPVFAEAGAEKTGFELTEWLSYQSESVFVKANETLTLPITVTVPHDASPGSHFGGIFVSQEPPRLRQMGAGVGYEVATIFSIRINGDVIDNARIRSFSTDKLFYGEKKVKFAAKIENQGNILIRPRGPLEIRGMFGGDPYVTTVNENLAGVFPNTVRELSFDWEEEGVGFGRYEAVLALAYEAEQGQRTIDASLVFWVFPVKVLVPIIIGFLTIILGGYFLTRYYIRQAVLRAQGSRRIISPRYRRSAGISRFTFVLIAILGTLVLFMLVLLVLFA
jgi:hypothetical protein